VARPGGMRGLWVVVRCVFFQNPCPWGSAFRSALLRAFGAKIGKGVGIDSNVNISFPWRLVVGDHVWIGDDVGLAQVTIELNVCVARRSFLCTARHDLQKF
jgi:putative colanic acid biosynthesis acetyltransferase WcaF